MVPLISWMLLLLCWFGCSRALLLVPPGAIDTVLGGRIAVLKNWLPVEEVNALRKDAAALHDLGSFSTDALSSYGSNGKFDPTRCPAETEQIESACFVEPRPPFQWLRRSCPGP